MKFLKIFLKIKIKSLLKKDTNSISKSTRINNKKLNKNGKIKFNNNALFNQRYIITTLKIENKLYKSNNSSNNNNHRIHRLRLIIPSCREMKKKVKVKLS